MKESGYYPPGAEFDPKAPWNESEDPDPKKVEVAVSTTLSRNTTVYTSDYNIESWEDCDTGDNGETIHTGGTDYDFSDTDFKEAYTKEMYTIEEVLNKVSDYALEQATKCLQRITNKGYKTGTDAYNTIMRQHNEWIKIHNSSLGWTEDEFEVIKD